MNELEMAELPSLNDILKRHKRKDPLDEMEEVIKKDVKGEVKEEARPIGKILSVKEAKELFVDLPTAHSFWLHNGKRLTNLYELQKELKMIGDAIFRHHVTPEKNDFANWVRDCLKDDNLAKELYISRTQDEMIRAVDRHISGIKDTAPGLMSKVKLEPDSSFIKFNIQPKRLEKSGFSIKPVTLKPDYSFIKVDRMKYNFNVEKEPVSINIEKSDTQLEKEVGEKRSLISEVDYLKKEKLSLQKDIDHYKKETQSLKTDVDLKAMKEEEERMVQELKRKEKAIKAEFEKLKAIEEVLDRKREEYGKRGLDVKREVKHEPKHSKMPLSPAEIMKKILDAKRLIGEKRYDQAKAMVNEIKLCIETSEIDPKLKKDVYYQLLELSTDLELSSM